MAAPTLAQLALQLVTQCQVTLAELRRDSEWIKTAPVLVDPSDSMDSLTNDANVFPPVRVPRHIIDHRTSSADEDDAKHIHHGARAARG